MHSFRQIYPQCAVHLQVCTPDDVSRRLLRGESDVGLKFSVAPEKNLKIEHQQPAPIHLLMAPNHALASCKQVRLEELVRYPLALPEPGATVQQMLDLCCSLKGLHYETAYTGNYATLLNLVMQGEVLTLAAVVSAAHAVREGTLVAVPVHEVQFQQRSVQVLRFPVGEPTPQSSLFTAHLIQAMRDSQLLMDAIAEPQ
jgi:DNA-binding transcriptional LysR family regulator